MEWIKRIIRKIFKINNTKLLEQPKIINHAKEKRNEFIVNFKRQVEIEQDDGNGYKIIQNIRLENMV